MSDIKRVQLKPCETTKSDKNDKKVKKQPKTHRITICLGESNSKTCPEYSFADLIKSERHNDSHNSDPFGDGDEDLEVATIAQRFEAKYGPKAMQTGKKKRTTEMDDFYDLGDGYDSEDPFIDNTEAYDEVVPSSMTTQHGGFYINLGKLDFKSVFDDSMEAFSSPQASQTATKKRKKKPLDSDSEEEEETGEALAKKFKLLKKKKLLEKKENEKKKKLSNGHESSAGEIVIKKKKKKNLEKLKRKMSATVPENGPSPNIQVSSSATTAVTTSVTSSNSVAVVTTNSSTPVTAASVVKTSTVTTTTATVEATAVTKTSSPDNKLKEAFESILQETMKDDSSSRGSGTEEMLKGESSQEQSQTAKSTQLPSQLPPTLAEAITSIKKEAKVSKEGKSKFFSPEVNRLLLEIELGSRNLASWSRSAVFNHLGEHLPCGKQAIMRRAKKLREGQQEDQLKGPMQMLKDAILKVMPEQIAAHEAEVAKAKLIAGEDASETAKEEASTESEGEEKATDGKKKSKLPRRKFQYTPEIKKLLLSVVSIKMKLFNTCKSRNEKAEDYLKTFLDTEVRTIWPQGWMQTRMLFKETKSVHEEFTKAAVKKTLLSNKKVPSPSPDVTATTTESQPRVSKTENVVEISSSKDLSSGSGVGSVVVNLPVSSTGVKQISTLPVVPAYSKAVPSAQTLTAQVTSVLASAGKPGKVGTSMLKTSTPLAQRPNAISATPQSSPVPMVQTSNNSSTQRTSEPVKSKTISGGVKPSTVVIDVNNSPDRSTSSVIEILDSPPVKKVGLSVSNSTTSGYKVPSPVPSQLSPGASLARQPSTSPSSQGRSFMAAFADFVGDKEPPAPAQTSPRSVASVQQKPVSPQLAKATATQLLKTASQMAKSSPGQNKPGGLFTNQKLSQDSKASSISQKAAISSSVVKKDYARANSSWAKVNNSVSSTNSNSNCNPSNTSSNTVNSGGSTLLPVPSQVKCKTGVSTAKSMQNSAAGNLFRASSNSTDKTVHQPGARVGNGSISTVNKGSTLIKTVPKSVHNSSMTPRVPPQLSPTHLLSSSQRGATFTPSPSLFSPHDSPSFEASYRRSNTPSPQKSPVSPSNAALSLYEQIQSQIRSQEATEHLALKNLSAALGTQGSGQSSKSQSGTHWLDYYKGFHL